MFRASLFHHLFRPRSKGSRFCFSLAVFGNRCVFFPEKFGVRSLSLGRKEKDVCKLLWGICICSSQVDYGDVVSSCISCHVLDGSGGRSEESGTIVLFDFRLSYSVTRHLREAVHHCLLIRYLSLTCHRLSMRT